MTNEQTSAFNNLKEAWRAHHDLRSRRAPLADRMDARLRLDAARVTAHQQLR